MDESHSTTCPYCGDALTGRQRKKCGKPECKRAYNNERNRVHVANYAKRYPEKRRERSRKAKRKWREAHPDEWMGRLGALNRANARKSRMRRAKTKLRRAARGAAGTAVWYGGRCHECGEPFVAKRTNDIPKFCSAPCKRKGIARRRRAACRGVDVTIVQRIAVFERDGWICRLCGDPVNRDADIIADDAPSLDHIVPLAAGGPHSFENLQCAHRYCNSVKGARDWSLVG